MVLEEDREKEKEFVESFPQTFLPSRYNMAA
jgi:hypothetical protein